MPEVPDPRPDDLPDPGGAHSKGFSADPDGAGPDTPDPIPLADAGRGRIHVPERDDGVRPTGRDDAGPHTRTDRMPVGGL